MGTPRDLVDLMVRAGQRADETHPGLRARDADAWMQIAAGYACWGDRTLGRKARAPGARISPDTLAAETSGGAFYAVSIIRDDPDHGNPWRPSPEDHGLVTGQHFIRVPALDPGPWGIDPFPPPPPDLAALERRVAALEAWARSCPR
jgi:hypothetical protein